MDKLKFILYFCALLLLYDSVVGYEATWDDLDSRPLPQWYDDAKIGIFIHWGVFSVPSYGSEWFWENWKGLHLPKYTIFMNNNYRPDFTYADFASMFTGEFFKPDDWADLFAASGARYVVLTSKHHEGYTNWPSKYSFSWNSMDVGMKRDIVGDLANSVKERTNLRFGLYHSLYEWFHPLYKQDKSNDFQTNNFVVSKTMPELYELVNEYKPEIIWSDGDWVTSSDYWASTTFLSWLFTSSPVNDTVVTNDRWGKDSSCKHGSYLTCSDRFNPGTLQEKKWENAMTLDKVSWGYRREATLSDIMTIEELLSELASTVSCGGNILINVGPTKEGTIVPIMEERLRQLGSWLDINGEAIYESTPWKHQNDSITQDVWYTSKSDIVYAIVLNWPDEENLELGSVVSTENSVIEILGYKFSSKKKSSLQYKTSSDGRMTIIFPSMSKMSSKWAWVLRMSNVLPAADKSSHE